MSLYRLTLGQSRQEELLDVIFSRMDIGDEDLSELFINLSPFYKKGADSFELECEKIKEQRKVLDENEYVIEDLECPAFPFNEIFQSLENDLYFND